MSTFQFCTRSFLRYIPLLSLLLLLSLADRASAADWATNYGGLTGANASIQATTRDTAGNRYLIGNFDGTTFTLGNVTLTKIGTQDAFVAKLDASGTVLWAKNFGGSGASVVGLSIAVDGSGNVYLGGYFLNANLTIPALTKIGEYDSFALKLDSSGVTSWAKNFGGSGARTYCTGITVDGSGYVYLGGYFQVANLTTPTLTKTGVQDVFVFKLDSNGAVTWAKNFGGSGASVYGQGIAVDGSGNVYLGGYFFGASLTAPFLMMVGTQDAFAFKLNSSGAVTWAKNFGGSGASVYGQCIAVDGSGYVYLGGYFINANLTAPAVTKIGDSDAFAFKLDTTGAVTWAKNFGGSGASATGRSIAVDGSGNVYLGGDFSNASLTTPSVTKIGDTDAFAFKLSSTGAVTWAKNFGGSGAGAICMSIAVDGSGNVYVGGGFFWNNLTSPSLTRIGSQDAFAFKLSPTSTIIWAKNFGGLIPGGNSRVSATAADASGNTYLAGSFSGATLTLGNITLSRIGSQDTFVAKQDSSGTVLWAKNFGGSSATVYGIGIAVDGSGNVYLGGQFTGADLTTPALAKIGTQDVFAFKLNSSGTTVWTRNYGGYGAVVTGVSIAVDGSGSVYLGGDFQGANLTSPPLTKVGTVDVFAFKLDSGGATTWAKNFGGIGAYAYGRGIAVDGYGNVYLGGYFSNANLTTPALTKIGGTDSFAFKLDSGGATTWAKNFGGIGAYAYGRGITVDGSGNVYLVGYSLPFNLTTPALTAIGGQDAFVFKLDSTGATTWARNFGGSGASTYGIGIAVDGLGNVYVEGHFQAANLTTPPLTKIGTYDTFALKLSSSGATVWAKNYGGTGASTYGLGIAVDGSGNIHLGGYFGGANLATPPLTRIGNPDAFIIYNQLSTLVFAADPHGSLSGATPQTVDYGGSASAVSATPSTGYHFVNWTGSGGFATTTANPLTVTGVTSSMAITANFAIDQYLLTVSLFGSGGGSVNSALPEPAGLISCASDSTSGCSNSFDYGTPVTLAATPDWKSTFTGWGVPCSGSGNCTVTMNGASGVSATFDTVPRVRIGGTTPVDYASLQDAYDHAGADETLKTKVFSFGENLLLTRDIAFTLDGGYSDDFASITGYTTILGTLTIEKGTATVSNLILE